MHRSKSYRRLKNLAFSSQVEFTLCLQKFTENEVINDFKNFTYGRRKTKLIIITSFQIVQSNGKIQSHRPKTLMEYNTL